MEDRVHEERLRVSRDLHDDLGQILMALKLELDMARSALGAMGDAARHDRHDGIQVASHPMLGRVRDGLGRASQLLLQAEQSLRDVVWGLRVAGGTPRGQHAGDLATRLHMMLADWGRREAWAVHFETNLTSGPGGAERLSRPTEAPHGPVRPAVIDALVRTAQEGLRNVARHGRASQVGMHLGWVEGRWQLDIQDNGRGLPAGDGSAFWGLGLQGLAERLQALGGQLQLSVHEQGGCVLRAIVLHAHAPQPDGSLAGM